MACTLKIIWQLNTKNKKAKYRNLANRVGYNVGMKNITLIKPDDAHLHLRDAEYLINTVPDAAKRFGRAVVMPNLVPPVTTLQQAAAYRARILAQVPAAMSFQPLMTLYLSSEMSTDLVAQAKASGWVIGFKLYPKGATTNSAAGVVSLQSIYPLLAALQEQDMPLLVHGESVDPAVDVFDREKVFLAQLAEVIRQFPKLRIVLEHITTRAAVAFILSAPAHIAATITVHHLLLNRNDLLVGGIRPHYYCLPILKRREDQQALIAAATGGNPKFFLGTDSAPHAVQTKEHSCGCAGIYSAHAALELYAEIFSQAGCLDKLEAFASRYAADFYRLPYNEQKITLLQSPWQVPQQLPFGDEQLVPLRAGAAVQWRIAE